AREAEARAIAAYRAALESGDLPAIRAKRQAADDATAAVEAVIDRIQRTAKRGASLARPRVEELSSLMARLAPNEAFVTYTYAGPQAVGLFVTKQEAHFVGLGKVEAVIRDTAGIRAEDPSEPVDAVMASLQPIGGHLVRRFPLPEGITRVYVSPE